MDWSGAGRMITADGKWMIQREHTHHEPPFYYLMAGPPGWKELAEEHHIRTEAFSDEGGLRRVQRAAERIAKIMEAEE